MSSQELTVGQIQGKRILYLVFATVTLLVLGLIYAWSIFAAPIGATFEDYKPLLPQVFQISMFAFCFSALAGAQVIKRSSAKIAIILAAVLMAVGFIATAYGAGLGIWALFLFYGVFAGSGCGIAYNAIISLVNPWFPDRIGFASGVMMMGFGISSLVFGSVANAMFGIMDWTFVFMIIAAVAFVVLLAFALIVKPAPGNVALKLGMSGAATTTKASATQAQPILKTKVFWVYCIWATFIIACGLTIIGTSAQGAAVLNLDVSIFAGFSALLVGLVSTMNGIGRIINGTLFDKFGLIPVMLIASVCAFLAMAGLALALATGIGALYIVGAILAALPYCSVPVMASAFARQRYGASGFAMNLGIANCNIGTGAVINIIILNVIGTPASTVNGPLVYGILAASAVVAFLATFVFGKIYKTDLATIAKELE